MSNEIVPRTSIVAMVGAYNKAMQDIDQALTQIEQAENNLNTVFQADVHDFDIVHTIRDRYFRLDDRKPLFDELKMRAWNRLVRRIELHNVVSIKRAKELEKTLSDPDQLPDITEESIFNMMQDAAAQLPMFLKESAAEVFDIFRRYCDEYKTNFSLANELGERVVLYHFCERGYIAGHRFQVNYYRRSEMIAIDNVFHSLDDKPIVRTGEPELIAAIALSETGKGETQYFEFKCFKNGNVHLKFKRPDLVKKLNAIVGGNTITDVDAKTRKGKAA